MKHKFLFILSFLIVLFSSFAFAEVILNDNFERSSFTSTGFWYQYQAVSSATANGTPIYSSNLGSLTYGSNRICYADCDSVGGGYMYLRQIDLDGYDNNVTIRFTVDKPYDTYDAANPIYKFVFGNGSWSTSAVSVGNVLLTLNIYEDAVALVHKYTTASSNTLCEWTNFTKPWTFDFEWYIDTENNLTSYYVINHSSGTLIYNCSTSLSNLSYNGESMKLRQLQLQKRYTIGVSGYGYSHYLDDLYIEDYSNEFGYTSCDNSPVITDISTVNANPICMPPSELLTEGATWTALFNVSTYDQCSNYTYWSCIDCTTELGYYAFDGYNSNFFTPYYSYNYDIKNDKNFTYRSIGSTGLWLNNSIPIALKHCLFDSENYSAVCSPVSTDGYFFRTQFGIRDNTAGVYNPLDIRFKDSSNNYALILMFNKSSNTEMNVYYYDGASYQVLWSNITDDYSGNYEMDLMIWFNFTSKTAKVTVSDFTCSVCTDTVLALPFISSNENVKEVEFYQEVGVRSYTSLTTQPNYISFWYSLLSASVVAAEYSQTIPYGTSYDILEDATDLGEGDHTLKVCVLNEQTSFSPKYDCEDYLITLKADCSAEELEAEGWDLNETIYDDDDLAGKVLSYWDAAGIKSIQSKMIIGVLILIIIAVLTAITTGGNLLVTGVITIATLFALVFLGLFPVWVIVLIIMVCGVAFFTFFRSQG